jgi:SAM-dependent methyltransferase
MAKVDTVFSGSIPSLYDRYLGPLIFEPYAADLADRLAALHPQRVLETAAGTGIVTRAMLRVLPPSVSLVATDLNQPMLDHAAEQVASDRVSFQKADALALPFADRSFDVVVCQFGVMFFPDRQKAYREARRVLKEGGHFIFSVWDALEQNAFADLTAAAVADMFPDDPPGFLARTPHGYHDERVIIADVHAAGFANVTVETVTRRSRAPTCRDPAIGFCQGSPLRSEIEARGKDRLDEATDAAAARISATFGEGPVDGMIQARIITASA